MRARKARVDGLQYTAALVGGGGMAAPTVVGVRGGGDAGGRGAAVSRAGVGVVQARAQAATEAAGIGPALGGGAVDRASTPRQRANRELLPEDLVYKVHPVPDSLCFYVFDFGALDGTTERLYVEAMMKKQHGGVHASEISTFSNMLLAAQKFIRETEGDDSAVSLRDIQRCLQLLQWFQQNRHDIHDMMNDGGSSGAGGVANGVQAMRARYSLRSYVLTVAMVFMYRLQSRSDRQQLWQRVCQASRDWTLTPERVSALIAREEKLFCDNIATEDGVALNEALRENIFVSSFLCVLPSTISRLLSLSEKLIHLQSFIFSLSLDKPPLPN